MGRGGVVEEFSDDDAISYQPSATPKGRTDPGFTRIDPVQVGEHGSPLIWRFDLPAHRGKSMNRVANRDVGIFSHPLRLRGPVEVRTGMEFVEAFKIPGTQFAGDRVFLVEPLAKVNQPAALGTERSPRVGEPMARSPALRAFHPRIVAIVHR